MRVASVSGILGLLRRGEMRRHRRVLHHKIHSPDEFRSMLQRERALVDRNGHSFSLVTFAVPEHSEIMDEEIFRLLALRVRLTDDIGWLDANRYGVLLRFTAETGAWKLARDASARMTELGIAPVCHIHTYPLDDGKSGEADNPNQRSFSDLCPGWNTPEQGSGHTAAAASAAMEPADTMADVLAHPVPQWKRATDIVLSLLLIILLSPVMLVIALYIRIVSPGPVFFRQERIGYKGQPFTCWKFRTMHVNADTKVHQQHLKSLMQTGVPMIKLDSRKDNRLIPAGSLLRATGLDELPQLLNVVKGDMSLIGPRPCIKYEFDQFDRWHKQRFMTLPGISGLWQVSGKNRTTFSEMMRLDVNYAHKKSFWTDLRIIVKTVPTLWDQAKRMLNSAGTSK